ncbi:MAG: hypothetical protein U0892_13215 [Pirellulales bacterium]
MDLGDLKSPTAIYAKGLLFVVMGLLSGSVLLADNFSWTRSALLLITIWAFCRAYYFAFYVIEHYIDGEYRFAGLVDFAKYLIRGRSTSKD